MKIALAGGMRFAKEMVAVRDRLVAMGHEVRLPVRTEELAAGTYAYQTATENKEEKIREDVIRKYFELLQGSDALLVLNFDKGELKNYIGGNTFLEMGFAHVLRKPIFVLNPLPDCGYRDELEAMEPMVLAGELTRI